MKVVLRKPVTLGETTATVTELNLREEVVAGDLRGVKFSSLGDPTPDDLLKIASRMCGQPEAVLNKLGLEDMAEVIEGVAGFIERGLGTGKKRSP